MRFCWGRYRSWGTAAAAMLIVSLNVSLNVPTAQAGQPWWCVCKGVPQRYTASTHICESDLYRRSHKTTAGFKAKGPQCTRAQWIAWNTKACRQSGCAPPKF